MNLRYRRSPRTSIAQGTKEQPYFRNDKTRRSARKHHMLLPVVFGACMLMFVALQTFHNSTHHPRLLSTVKVYPLMIDYRSGTPMGTTNPRLFGSMLLARRGPWRRDEETEESSSDDSVDEGCVYRDWHYKDTYMTCNAMHEINIAEDQSLTFIACSSNRCVYRLWADIDQRNYALKVERLHDGEQMTEDIWEQQRKDSMALERLTASPYIPNMYANCAVGQILECADNGSLGDLIKATRLSGEDKMPSIDKLSICLQIAEGVAAVHSIEKDGVPSLAHNDLDTFQFVNIDGVYKLNDFDFATFLPKHEATNKLCAIYNDDLFDEYVSAIVDSSGNLFSCDIFSKLDPIAVS